MGNRMAVAGRGHAVISRYSALFLAVLCATAAPGVASTGAGQNRASDAESWEPSIAGDNSVELHLVLNWIEELRQRVGN